MAADPSAGPTAIDPAHDRRHAAAAVEEWVFTCWRPEPALGVVAAFRITPSGVWYWSALVRDGHPLLHVTEWAIVPRGEAPTVLKAHGLWAEHVCDEPMVQWTVENECYAAALDDPDDAWGRAYGLPTAYALDLEWYATSPPVPTTSPEAGYGQDGVVHGVIDVPGERIELAEVPARRWHRWGNELGPLTLEDAYAHTGLRAPFAFPDGHRVDWVLTPDGFRTRRDRPTPSRADAPPPSR